MTKRYSPEFHMLVRKCADAQEAFDNWDEGVTRIGKWHMRCTLNQVMETWEEANAELVRWCQQHGYDIIKEGNDDRKIRDAEGRDGADKAGEPRHRARTPD